MKTKFLLASILALSLVGCATDDYTAGVKAQTLIEVAKYNAVTAGHKADEARYKATAIISASGSEGAKVAGVMSMNQGSGNGGNGNTQTPQSQTIAPPKTFGETMLQWAGVLAGPMTNVAGSYFNYRSNAITSNNNAAVSIAQSNNATALGVSTNSTFSNGFSALQGTAGLIQAPQPNITISGTGSVNTGAGNSTFAQTASAGSVIGTGTANTLSGQGVIGNGTYTKKNCNSTGAASGNTGPGGNGTGGNGTGASGTGATGTGTGATGTGATGTGTGATGTSTSGTATGGNGTATGGNGIGGNGTGTGGNGTGGNGTGGTGTGAASGNTGPGGSATVGC
jgi:hypothetical protein